MSRRPPSPSSNRTRPAGSSYSTLRYDDPPSTAPPPSRPERSQRRPLLGTPSPATTPTLVEGRFPDIAAGTTSPPTPEPPVRPTLISTGSMRMDGTRRGAPTGREGLDAGTKSKRMMERLNLARQPTLLKPSTTATLQSTLPLNPSDSIRRAGHSRNSSGSSNSSATSSARPPSPNPAKEEVKPPSAAISSAISAFSNAGARRDNRRGPVPDRPKPKARTRLTTAYLDTPAFREVAGVLGKIGREWPVLMYGTTANEAEEGSEDKEFDLVTLALGLLAPSSVGTPQSLSSFLRLKSELEHAIQSTLSSTPAAYRSFESSITNYNSSVTGLSDSQKRVAELKKSLREVRAKLEGQGREALGGMGGRLKHLEEMGKILDEIDTLRAVPDRLETLLSEKRFLAAVVLLVRSLKIVNKPEMMEIGALGDLRAWLGGQESVLLEILIEELQNHLYLKSFYCDARWKAYTSGQSELPILDRVEDATQSHDEASDSTPTSKKRSRSTKLHRYLNDLSLRPSHNPLTDEPIDDASADVDTPSLTEDLDLTNEFSNGSGASGARKNPEAESFPYIESLLESLSVLGKLGVGLDAVSQRVGSEMFALVDGVVDEVEERSSLAGSTVYGTTPFREPTSQITNANSAGSLATLSSLSASHRASLLRLTAKESSQLAISVETLRDLFWTLYSKVFAVLEGFRAAWEVAGRIAERRDFKDSLIVKTSSGALMFSLLEVWKPVQQEVRALLHDYLTEDQTGTISSRNPIVSVNEVLRLARPRDSAKQIFKFADSDLKESSKALKFHEDELNQALKSVVPGLVTDAITTSSQSNPTTLISEDRYAMGGGASGGTGAGTHKALVPADAFNVSVLFGPTLAFLNGVKEIMPMGLLTDEEAGTVTAGFTGLPNTGAFEGFLDEFVVRTFLPQLEEKVTSIFQQAVEGHDSFLDDPSYRKNSSLPIVKAVSNLMLLINSLCSMLRSTPFHRDNYSLLIVRVIQQFYSKCQGRFRDFTARDDIGSHSNSKLATSATWASIPEVNMCMVELHDTLQEDSARLVQAVTRETKIELETKGNAPIKKEDLISHPKRLVALATLHTSLEWFIGQLSSIQFSPTGGAAGIDANSANISLPLSEDMVQPLVELLASYRLLSLQMLFTLRLEIRLRTIHYLDKATRDGVYLLAKEDLVEPDFSVIELNSDLALVDEGVGGVLDASKRRFIFQGLASLMDQLLISNSRHIRLINVFGLGKMMRNILALQQNLKNLGELVSRSSSGIGGNLNGFLASAERGGDFERSRKFYELFSKGPKPMLEAIRSKQISYDFEDYKSLLNLMCGIDQSPKDSSSLTEPGHYHSSSTHTRMSSNNPSGVVGTNGAGGAAAGDKSKRLYNEYLIELFALDGEN